MTAFKKGPTELMKRFLPAFCWQTSFEILTMLEQYDLNNELNDFSLKMAISQLAKDGRILKRKVKKPFIPIDKQMQARFEYRRNPKWSFTGRKW